MAAPNPYTFCVVEHQHKARSYVRALQAEGYLPKRRVLNVNFLLIDHEWQGLFAGHEVKWRKQIMDAEKFRTPVFVYPHSVRPNIPHDLTDQFYPVASLFTIARGHKSVLEVIGYPHPIEVVGWPYSDICDFQKKEPQGKIKVLFAPIHPVGNGHLPADEKALNTKTFQLLLGLADKISISVRHIQSPEKNGIWRDDRVKYIDGSFDGSTADMDRAHVIIAGYTFASMAVALGHPLIMMGNELLAHNSPRKDGTLVYVRNWDRYRDFMRYPMNMEECKNSRDLEKLINRALDKNGLVQEWKTRFIGKPFDGKKFVRTLEARL